MNVKRRMRYYIFAQSTQLQSTLTVMYLQVNPQLCLIWVVLLGAVVLYNLYFENNGYLFFRLTKQVWQAGDVAKLKIIITNNTNVNVSKITIKVGELTQIRNWLKSYIEVVSFSIAKLAHPHPLSNNHTDNWISFLSPNWLSAFMC